MAQGFCGLSTRGVLSTFRFASGKAAEPVSDNATEPTNHTTTVTDPGTESKEVPRPFSVYTSAASRASVRYSTSTSWIQSPGTSV